MEKIIVSCAITGAIHTPSMSDFLPITPKDIAEQAVAAYEAGAAVVHCHARNPKDGSPSIQLEHFREIGERIKQKCPVIVCFTTGGSATASSEERAVAVKNLKPELCSFTPGSCNFSVHPMAAKKREWKHEWEQKSLLASEGVVFSNSFKNIREYAEIFAASQTRPEFEIFGISMLNNLSFVIKQGLVKPKPYLQYVLGILGGEPGDIETLVVLLQQARRLIGDCQWSVCGGGANQYALAVAAMSLGATGVRVGLEDSLYIGKGKLAKSNAEVVEKIVRLAKEFDRETATPDEARQILGLKGKDNVAF
jgi:uncharacterized protein (DUF849 family)